MLAYCASMQCDVQNKREVLLGDAPASYLPHETENADDSMSRSMVTVKRPGDGNKSYARDVCSDSTIDALIDNNTAGSGVLYVLCISQYIGSRPVFKISCLICFEKSVLKFV